jgi:hypothetical protein
LVLTVRSALRSTSGGRIEGSPLRCRSAASDNGHYIYLMLCVSAVLSTTCLPIMLMKSTLAEEVGQCVALRLPSALGEVGGERARARDRGG